MTLLFHIFFSYLAESELTCDPPPPVDTTKGRYSPISDTYHLNAKVQYKCNGDLLLWGAVHLTCTTNDGITAIWSPYFVTRECLSGTEYDERCRRHGKQLMFRFGVPYCDDFSGERGLQGPSQAVVKVIAILFIHLTSKKGKDAKGYPYRGYLRTARCN